MEHRNKILYLKQCCIIKKKQYKTKQYLQCNNKRFPVMERDTIKLSNQKRLRESTCGGKTSISLCGVRPYCSVASK